MSKNKQVESQGTSAAKASAARTSPAQFIREVRSEAKKVVWPTRKETMLGTIMVLIMASIMGLFFLGVDQVIAWAVRLLIG
ncbi:MAG: preprotein translocase subunit SecE [Alphaproteobacteria bacterium]